MGLFSTGKGAVKRAARDATAAQEGRAWNLSTAADNWYNDPARGAQRGDFMDAYRAMLGQSTDEQFADSDRQRRISTAGRGLTGGSVDVQLQQRGLQDLFKRRLANEQTVQDAGRQLQQQDLATYQQMLAQAYGAGSGTGQPAIRGMIGQQAQNANDLSGVWPSIFGDMARGAGKAWGTRYGYDLGGG